MTLRLWYHPYASFCRKILIALDEAQIAVEFRPVDLGDPADRAALAALWPPMRFPVLEDAGRVIPETTIIAEHLALGRPAMRALLPEGAAGVEIRLWDRLMDLMGELPMQKIVGDWLRPAEARDPHGLAEAETQLRDFYALIERQLAHGRDWIAGADFSLADCAAQPALHFARRVAPPLAPLPRFAAYCDRLDARPSVQRVDAAAAPFDIHFPVPGA
ncbi:glutathione S-transferase family protein [Frigidibacter sp. MR17.14]|uniref:glutathione S-transferase family protein n=1 Tax=Frigidibacter sp. MR17.14 TaxID=3126509 RepID=UPI00301301BE